MLIPNSTSPKGPNKSTPPKSVPVKPVRARPVKVVSAPPKRRPSTPTKLPPAKRALAKTSPRIKAPAATIPALAKAQIDRLKKKLAGRSIPIDTFVAELAAEFGADIVLPATINRLTVGNVVVEYDTGTNHFTTSCESKLPIIGDLGLTDRELDLAITVDCAPKKDESGKETGDGYDITFGGILKVGELKFELDYQADGTLRGSTSDNVEIDLKTAGNEVFELFGFELPQFVPDMTLENLFLAYNSDTKGFEVGGKNKNSSKISLGTLSCDIETDLELTSELKAGARTYSGCLRGDITIGTATFQGKYDFGNGSTWKATWERTSVESLDFTDLAAGHGGDHSLAVPEGLSLKLDRAAFEHDVTKGSFTLSADSKYGRAFFLAGKVNGDSGFAFGIEMKLSDLPGFPDLGSLEVKDAILVLSTVEDDNFIVPTLPDVPLPTQSAGGGRTFPTLGTNKMHLRKGVSVAALLEFETDPRLQKLDGVIGKSRLLIQAAYDPHAHSISFVAHLDGSLTILGEGDDKLVLIDPFVQVSVQEASFAVALAGTVLIAFHQVTLQASGALVITENEMVGQLQVKTGPDGKPLSLPVPFGLRGVTLNELDIQVGVVFVPSGIELGIEGKFDISGQQASNNQFTIVLALEGEVPNPRYLATHIDSLTIADMVHAYTGDDTALAIPLPDFFNQVKGEDLSVYWAESPGIALPDGTLSRQGFGFNGILTIAGFAVHAKLDVSSATGVCGDGEMPPINWGPLSLTGCGVGVSRQQVLIIPPGGATIAINSNSSPYFDISAKASLFNLISEEVDIQVANDCLKFKQTVTIGSLYRTELGCEITGSGFEATGQFYLGIKGDVDIEILGIDFGSISLDVEFDTSLGISVDANRFAIEVSGSFEFEGLTLTMPSFTIKKDFQSLEELPDRILKQIQDKAEDIFEDIYNEARKLLHDAEEIAEDIALEARQIAHEAEVAAMVAAKGIEDGAKAVYESATLAAGTAEKAAAELEQETEKVVSIATVEVAKIGAAAVADVEKLGGEAAGVLLAAGNEALKIEQSIEQEVAQIGAEAEKICKGAVDVANAVAKEATKDCEVIAQTAVAVANAIANEAVEVVNALKNAAEEIGHQIEDKVNAAKNWVERISPWH